MEYDKVTHLSQVIAVSIKVGVWCALSWDKIIGPIFVNKTVDGAEYERIITDFIANLLVEERYCYL